MMRFPTTRWSLVVRAASHPLPDARLAMGELLGRYLQPIKAYLVRGRGIPSQQADDLVQGFIASKVLGERLLVRADRGRGRLRTFLLAALDRYLRDSRKYDGRARRSNRTAAAPIHAAREMATSSVDPAAVLEQEWAREILGQALLRMRQECHRRQRADLWMVFEARVVGPTLEQRAAISYQDLVRAGSVESAQQAANLLVAAKRMFQRHLREIFREYARDEVEVDQEVADMRRALSRGY